jgi:hypothetical protein
MYVRMYVCVYMHTCMRVCVCCVHVRVRAFVYLCVCMYVYVCVFEIKSVSTIVVFLFRSEYFLNWIIIVTYAYVGRAKEA